MRSLKYKADAFSTDTAHVLCAELEAALGLRLCVTNPLLPNDVHGYLNTGYEGVEVCLYEQADCEAIEAKPPVVRFARCPDCNREQNDWTDPDVCEDCGHDIDFQAGREQRLKAHSGIYKASSKTDNAMRTAIEAVLVTVHKMARHEDNTDGRPIRQPTHEIDAHERAAAKLERKADALMKRAR